MDPFPRLPVYEVFGNDKGFRLLIRIVTQNSFLLCEESVVTFIKEKKIGKQISTQKMQQIEKFSK